MPLLPLRCCFCSAPRSRDTPHTARRRRLSSSPAGLPPHGALAGQPDHARPRWLLPPRQPPLLLPLDGTSPGDPRSPSSSSPSQLISAFCSQIYLSPQLIRRRGLLLCFLDFLSSSMCTFLPADCWLLCYCNLAGVSFHLPASCSTDCLEEASASFRRKERHGERTLILCSQL